MSSIYVKKNNSNTRYYVYVKNKYLQMFNSDGATGTPFGTFTSKPSSKLLCILDKIVKYVYWFGSAHVSMYIKPILLAKGSYQIYFRVYRKGQTKFAYEKNLEYAIEMIFDNHIRRTIHTKRGVELSPHIISYVL